MIPKTTKKKKYDFEKIPAPKNGVESFKDYGIWEFNKAKRISVAIQQVKRPERNPEMRFKQRKIRLKSGRCIIRVYRVEDVDASGLLKASGLDKILGD